jgi:hypothetical protein
MDEKGTFEEDQTDYIGSDVSCYDPYIVQMKHILAYQSA